MQPPNENSFPFPDLDFVLVEGGAFMMGGDQYEREKPVHEVQVSSFYLCKYAVTQRLWQSVMGNNPSTDKGEKRPVETVNWEDAKEFTKKLGKETGHLFRLPTEAEWEYAALGGRYSQGYTYTGSDKLKQVGWYRENSNNETKEVGRLLENELGLYDMSGNVYEWCEDDWHDNYRGAPEGGFAWIDSPDRGSMRVMRGSSYFNDPVGCRPAYRNRDEPGYRGNLIGFRLALSLQSVG